VFELTGNRIEDHPVIVNLMWERDNRRQDFSRVYKAMTIDGFVRYRLTGKYTMHVSAGWSYGLVYDMRNHTINDDMIKTIGFSKELFPEITACDDIMGEVTAYASAQCGLSEGTLVAGGQLDCNAGWLGGGAIEEGDVHMNLGTCGNFGIIHRDKDFVPNMLVAAYTIDSKHTNITIPTTTTGGQSLRYLRDNFSQLERAAESVTGMDAYDMLNIQGEKVGPGSDGVIILPYLMGERSPIWDVYARGVVFGLSLSHTKAHIIRATMEAVAYALYDSFRLIMETGKKLKFPIVLNEGGAKSRLWRRIITDVFNVPTVMLKSRTGAPFGDAVLAAVAEGTFRDYTITRERAEYIDRMEPDPNTHELYMRYFDLYKDVYNDLKDDFKKLDKLRTTHNGGLK
jgi:xylulokinase